jgi:Domain of unknown function (DUF4091)
VFDTRDCQDSGEPRRHEHHHHHALHHEHHHDRHINHQHFASSGCSSLYDQFKQTLPKPPSSGNSDSFLPPLEIASKPSPKPPIAFEPPPLLDQVAAAEPLPALGRAALDLPPAPLAPNETRVTTIQNGPDQSYSDNSDPPSGNADRQKLTAESKEPSTTGSMNSSPEAATPLANTGNFQVSLIDDMVQIPMTGELPGSHQKAVYAGRNDVQSIQIGIHAPDGKPLSNVDVSVSDLTASNGSKIDKSKIDLYREHYVQVTKSSNAWQGAGAANPAGPPGWYADGLIPFIDPATGKPGDKPRPGLEGNHFNVAAGQNQPIWADVNVPKGTAPGDYTAKVTIDSNQGTVQVPLSVHVWNFDAPTTSKLRTSFNATGASNDAALQKVLLDNKISPAASDPDKEKEDLAKGLNARGLPFYSGADYNHPVMSGAPSVAAIEAAKHAVNPANDPNLLLYDYSADEIWGKKQLYPQITQWSQNLHAAGVKNMITMPPDPALLSDGTSSGKPAVDIFTMLPVQFDKADPKVMQEFKDKGGEMWSYNTLVQDNFSPKWLIDFPPVNERQQAGFISQSNGLTGLLGWSVSQWSGDAWNNPYKQFQAGEGALVLPGKEAGLQGDAPTIRLKALRDGVADYNYVQILKDKGDADFANKISYSVGASFRNWSRDPDAIEQAHEALGEEIERRSQHTEPTE